MKKLLILPILLGLAACDDAPIATMNLRCANVGNIQDAGPYNDFKFSIYDGYLVLEHDSGVNVKVPLALQEDAVGVEFDATGVFSVGVFTNDAQDKIAQVSVNGGVCDTVVPFGYAFTAQCVHDAISAQIFEDYALLSVGDGEEMKLPLVELQRVEDEGSVLRKFKSVDTGWGLQTFEKLDEKSVFQIGLIKPEFLVPGTMAYGCIVYTPLR